MIIVEIKKEEEATLGFIIQQCYYINIPSTFTFLILQIFGIIYPQDLLIHLYELS
jgi:hypothetical protein